MYKISAHFGASRNESPTLPEQDCDIVMCHFSRIHYTKMIYIIIQKMQSVFPDIRNVQEISPDYPPKMDTLVAV